MTGSTISWYSINDDLAVEDHGPVGLDEALKIVDRYLARCTEQFDDAEKAIAATMFGFSRSKSTFIEICVNDPTQISLKIEISGPESSLFKRLFKGVFRHEEELKSREDVVQRVQQFFTMSPQDIQKKLTAGS